MVSDKRGGPMPYDIGLDPDTPAYVISVAAELTGLHPQTLRTYDRLGLVKPGRTGGGGRMYSARDIETLRHVTQLSASGIGLEGVKRILALEAEVESLREQVARLEARLRAATRLSPEADDRRPARARPMSPPYQMERLPERSTAVVLWSRSGRSGSGKAGARPAGSGRTGGSTQAGTGRNGGTGRSGMGNAASGPPASGGTASGGAAEPAVPAERTDQVGPAGADGVLGQA